jgi:NADPH:quinone reductase-like Zn-dependent oxidoreductase
VGQLQFGEAPEPRPGPGEVLVKVLGTSVNPIDFKIRRGDMKERMPLGFPAILGRDVAGEVVAGGGDRLKTGQRVMGLVNQAYAEFLVAKAEDLTTIPDDLESEYAAALPLILLTGAQLVELGVKPQQGDIVLITGALGSVGRTAVFVAKSHGAHVIAGVKTSQLDEATSIGADQVLAIDDDSAIHQIGEVDAIADTVDHEVIGKLLPHLKKGGRLATVLGKPKAAEGLDIQVVEVWAKPDSSRLHALAGDVQNGKLKIPIAKVLPLSEAGKAQEMVEKGSAGGKIVLVP